MQYLTKSGFEVTHHFTRALMTRHIPKASHQNLFLETNTKPCLHQGILLFLIDSVLSDVGTHRIFAATAAHAPSKLGAFTMSSDAVVLKMRGRGNVTDKVRKLFAIISQMRYICGVSIAQLFEVVQDKLHGEQHIA